MQKDCGSLREELINRRGLPPLDFCEGCKVLGIELRHQDHPSNTEKTKPHPSPDVCDSLDGSSLSDCHFVPRHSPTRTKYLSQTAVTRLPLGTHNNKTIVKSSLGGSQSSVRGWSSLVRSFLRLAHLWQHLVRRVMVPLRQLRAKSMRHTGAMLYWCDTVRSQ